MSSLCNLAKLLLLQCLAAGFLGRRQRRQGEAIASMALIPGALVFLVDEHIVYLTNRDM